MTADPGDNAHAMTPLLAAYADQVLRDAFFAFLPVAGIAAAFGLVYWIIRRRKSQREDAARRAWLEERRAKRGGEAKEPADR